MNILKRELRAGFKTLILWMIGTFLLIYIGIIKYEGVSAGGAAVSELLSSMPRVLLAILGIIGIDINTLGGYASILFYFVLLFAVVYSVHLGSSAVTRESADKTYEFIFTKPVSRVRILAMKLSAAWISFLLFCALTTLVSLMAVSSLKTSESMTVQILLFNASVFLVGSLFIALSALLAAAAKRPEKGSLYGNLAFLYAFILGVVCNVLENPGLLKLLSPITYFSPADLIAARLDPVYAVITLALAAAFLAGAFALFRKKDLSFSV